MAAPVGQRTLQFYELTHSVNASISSGIYVATGLRLESRRLMQSFLRTLARDFVLAYGARGSISLIPRLLQLTRVDAYKDTVESGTWLNHWCRGAVLGALMESFGVEAARFGLFVALYFSSYKTVERLMRHWRRERDDWRNAFVGGTVASLSLFVMRGDEGIRWSLAQYLAMRAAQCLYNHLSRAHPALSSYFHYGDVALFSLSCAQLLYGFFVRDETLDPEYARFVERLVRVDSRLVDANRALLRRRDAMKITGGDLVNVAMLAESVHRISPAHLPADILRPLLADGQLSCLPCSMLHLDKSCVARIGDIWSFVFRQAVPMYFSLHLVPSLLFRLRQFIKEPSSQMIHTVRNTIQSASFLATCAATYQTLLCGGRAAFSRQLLRHDWRYYYWIIGLFAGTTVLIEKKPRRTELALYLLPKGLSALYRTLLSRQWMLPIPRGDFILFSLSMAVLMSYYRKQPDSVTPLVAKILQRFL